MFQNRKINTYAAKNDDFLALDRADYPCFWKTEFTYFGRGRNIVTWLSVQLSI